MERRNTGTELRAEGRRLSGVVLTFGEVSPSHRERFVPGSLRLAEAVHLDLHHDPERAIAWHPRGGLELRNEADALRMSAELPPIPAADRALAEVRAGRASGLSVEFRAVRETREAGLRVIEEAVLSGIGLVRAPSYEGSRVEARARSGRTLRSSVPYDSELACECIAQGQSAAGCVAVAKFSKMAGEVMAQAVNEAYEAAANDILAVYKDYSRPLGSARRGTLRARDGEDGLEVEVDLPTGEAGDMALSASEAAGIIVRPLIDMDRSEYTDTDRGREYTRPHLRAFLVGSTDSRQGWPDARIDYDGEGRRAAPERRRRLWL